jgi:hypothetical protein
MCGVKAFRMDVLFPKGHQPPSMLVIILDLRDMNGCLELVGAWQ